MNRGRTNTLFCAIALTLLLMQVHAPAQAVSGDLGGAGLDATGASIPDASVAALNQGTNIRYTTTTNNSGEYRIANLPPGTYDITASKSGFAPSTLTDVAIKLSFTATANIS